MDKKQKCSYRNLQDERSKAPLLLVVLVQDTYNTDPLRETYSSFDLYIPLSGSVPVSSSKYCIQK